MNEQDKMEVLKLVTAIIGDRGKYPDDVVRQAERTLDLLENDGLSPVQREANAQYWRSLVRQFTGAGLM